MRLTLKLLILAGCVTSILVPMQGSASDFGITGLIYMPSARMADDGSLEATIRRANVADIYNLSYQTTPWLETTFRYSIFNPRRLSFSSDTLRDRSYEAKARVVRERGWLPDFAVGVRDILGTGVWEGEYVVASKKLGRMDFTVGLGWGRLATRNQFDNPLNFLNDAFGDRPGAEEKTGGKYGGESRSKSYFRGPAAWFGGVRYQLNRAPLGLIAEFNSDKYSREVGLNTIKSTLPLNFGIEWSPLNGMTVAATWLHGSSFGLRFSGSLDTKTLPRRKKVKAIYSADEARSLSRAPQSLDIESWYDRLLYDAERSGLRLNKAGIDEEQGSVTLEVANTGYGLTADAIHKVLGLAEVHLPRNFESIDVVLREEEYLAPTIRYQRKSTVSRNNVGEGGRAEKGVGRSRSMEILPSRRIGFPSNVTEYQYPTISLGADFSTRVQLMDPNNPLTKQLYAKLSSRVSIAPNLNLWGVYGQDIYNDFSADRKSNSLVQKVRSDLNYYLTEGESGIDQLFFEYKNSLGASFHFRTYAGILESMYAGFGGEILYEPFAQRWALGATLNGLKQRGFKKNLELKNYATVTGFISLYYASPWYNADIAIHSGRYLARDKGVTFEVRRSFDNGFSIGGFFTRTNMPAELFGEGSFDKGLFFKIPFDGILGGNSKASYATILRPLDRDGGRRLEDFSGTLWFSRRNVRYDALLNNTDRMEP